MANPVNQPSPAHRPRDPRAHGSSPYWLRIAGYAISAGLGFVVLALVIVFVRIIQLLPVTL